MSDLAKRLANRAKAFNDAGLRYGVADLLLEAATEIARLQQSLELTRLTEFMHRWNEFDSDDCYHGEYSGGPNHGESYSTCERQAAAIRAQVLPEGDSNG